MHAEFDKQIEDLRSEISVQLKNRDFVFLILTNDYLLNNSLKENLISGKHNGKTLLKKKYHLLKNELTDNPDEIYWVELPKITQEITTYFSNNPANQTYTKHKLVYLIREPISPRFIEFIYKDSGFSSCIFISDRLQFILPGILNQQLTEILDQSSINTNHDYFSRLIQKQKVSLGKLIFFLQNHKDDFLKLLATDKSEDSEKVILQDFLDTKGAEFLDLVADKVPINSIEIFFRSFIYIDGNTSIPIELEIDEIKSFSLLPAVHFQIILDLAKSERINLLTEGENGYSFAVPEYLFEWKDLKRWIENEETSFKHIKQLEEWASDFFKSSGTLLSKEQIEQAVTLSNEIFLNYSWEKKYKIDKDLISSFILLSQKNLEEELKTQQKKRASLLKNSIRISIAVSIAFLFSSFTALLAYLERNSAIVQQELAIKSKEEAVEAREIAEKERQEAVTARKNENLALQKAEADRFLALDAKSQAEYQRKIAVDAQNSAEISAKAAYEAKVIAEKNEKEATEAKIEALVNFETSEKLRNQQEARATALEALGYFANNNFQEGTKLVKDAYTKNLSNEGFPLQSDIFNGILNAINQPNSEEGSFDLTYPAKFLSLSPGRDLLAVYTINGEIRIYSTPSKPVLQSTIKTGYIKNFNFLSSKEIICQEINGKISAYGLNGMQINTPLTVLPQSNGKDLIKVYGQDHIWLIKSPEGNPAFFEYSAKSGFTPLLSKNENSPSGSTSLEKPLYWIEGKDFFQFNPTSKISESIYKAPNPISSISWSAIHQRWILGLESGQILSVDPKKVKSVESFTIHASKVSQLAIIPFAHNTELMISTGFDGGLLFFVFDKKIPLSASISSRIKFQGHKSWITGFTIDEKSKLAYSISNDKTLKTWSLKIEDLF